MSSSRRAFLRVTGGALLGASLPATVVGAPWVRGRARRADLVLRGGTVFDGTGAEGREADVAVTGGRIEAVGARLAVTGGDELDLRGLDCLCPPTGILYV